MKTQPKSVNWVVKCLTHADGRRVISLSRKNGPRVRPSRAARKFRSAGRNESLKLRVEFADEESSAFRPVIYARLPARRRFDYRPTLELLNAW